MTLEYRNVPDHELTAYRHVMMTTFGDDLDRDPEGADPRDGSGRAALGRL